MRSFDATEAWRSALEVVGSYGAPVVSRGRRTHEVLHRLHGVDMLKPALLTPARKWGARFAAAEALWILRGDNRVEPLARHSERVRQFSDDGETFFGAYGPKIIDQLGHVLGSIARDPGTRQASINIWRENPPDTKDVPCTMAMNFQARGGRLHLHVFMRSSDVWLGIPYDVFSFSMLGAYVCGRLARLGLGLAPGTLYLTAASSHLYDDDAGLVKACLTEPPEMAPAQHEVPAELWAGGEAPDRLLDQLAQISDGDRAARWWAP